MPLSKQHKALSREKILNSAVELFSSRGFSQVSIDDIMQNAKLTRGAFYAHFKSKQALYAEAIRHGAKRGQLGQCTIHELQEKTRIKTLISNYLSAEHLRQIHSPCPLAFLATDIANTESEVKTTYTDTFKALNRAFKKALSTHQPSTVKPPDIYTATTLMVGSVAVCRALNDEKMINTILTSSRQQIFKLLNI